MKRHSGKQEAINLDESALETLDSSRRACCIVSIEQWPSFGFPLFWDNYFYFGPLAFPLTLGFGF
jgi:hypothetical protein